MVTVQELIDSEFAVNKDDDTITAIIKFDLKKSAVDAGILEDFAKLYGWTPTVTVDGVETDNPVKCQTKCREVIVGFVNDVAGAIVNNRINTAADLQKAQIKAAFGINS